MKLWLHCTILLIFTLGANLAIGQRDSSYAVGLGIYMDYYLPGNTTANFYNGQDNNRLQNTLNNPQIRDQIEEALGGYTFQLAEYANDMRYNNALAFHLELDYRFGNNWKASIGFISANIEAVGNFTLLVDRVNRNNQTNDPYLEKSTINGKESRSHILLGLGKLFPLNDGFFASADAGFNMNFIEVTSNKFQVASRNFSLPLYNNQLNPQVQNINTFGSGFYLAGGVGYELPNGYGFSLKLNYINTRVNVNDVRIATTSNFILGFGLLKAW